MPAPRKRVLVVFLLSLVLPSCVFADELGGLLLKIEQQSYSWTELDDFPKDRIDALSPVPRHGASFGILWREDSWSQLTSAIKTEDWILSSYLIGRGANVNQCTRFGYSPLWLLAARSSQTDESLRIAAMLLAKGAKPDVTPSTIADLPAGETPLHLAASRQSAKLIKLLLAFGANAGLKTSDGKTPRDYLDEEISLRERVSSTSARAQKLAFPLGPQRTIGLMSDRELQCLRSTLEKAE